MLSKDRAPGQATEAAVADGEPARSPRGDLTFSCSRRRFLPMLVREAMVTLGMFRGRPGFRLADLGSLPDDQLATIRPVVNPAYQIQTREGTVTARFRQTGAVVELFAVEDTTALAAFNLFDGRNTLAQVGERLDREMEGEAGQGFPAARELFLSLAANLVCVPKDPLELA